MSTYADAVAASELVDLLVQVFLPIFGCMIGLLVVAFLGLTAYRLWISYQNSPQKAVDRVMHIVATEPAISERAKRSFINLAAQWSALNEVVRSEELSLSKQKREIQRLDDIIDDTKTMIARGLCVKKAASRLIRETTALRTMHYKKHFAQLDAKKAKLARLLKSLRQVPATAELYRLRAMAQGVISHKVV